MTTFAPENLVPQAPIHGVLRIKRESGENPEQTRCCISHQVVMQLFSVTVHPAWMGRPHGNGMSQKTCQVGHIIALTLVE